MDRIENLRDAHETETTIRIKFETKVNALHSLHRSLEDKYARGIREIVDLEELLKSRTSACVLHVEELLTIKNQLIDFESRNKLLEGEVRENTRVIAAYEHKELTQTVKIENL